MSNTALFKTALIKEVPALRAFALSLCGKHDRADDLVQETMVKSWAARESFAAGTNLRAWLFTILRNHYFTELRKRKREVEDADGSYAASLTTLGNQEAYLDFADFQSALNTLSDDQREVLVLIGASGFSYEEAAHICGVAVGTIKSRLNRARAKLAELLNIHGIEDLAPDGSVQSALSQSQLRTASRG